MIKGHREWEGGREGAKEGLRGRRMKFREAEMKRGREGGKEGVNE